MFPQAKFILNYMFRDKNNLEKLIKKNKKIEWSNKIKKLKDLNKLCEVKINCSKKELEKKIRSTNTELFKTNIILHGKKFVYSDD